MNIDMASEEALPLALFTRRLSLCLCICICMYLHMHYTLMYTHIQGRRKDSRARGVDRRKRASTTLGQQIHPRNGGHPRHFLGNIIGYASLSHVNDCLFQSNIACF